MRKHSWIIILTASILLIFTVAVLTMVVSGMLNSNSEPKSYRSEVISIPETTVKTETIPQPDKINKNPPIIESTNNEVMVHENSSANSVDLLFLGDVMLGRYVSVRSQKAGDTSYPFQKIINSENNVFSKADVVIANLEGPVTTKRAAPDKGEVDFMFSPAVAKMLKDVGVSAVSQANNHALDQGRAGADESRKLLQEAGLKVFGDQVNDDTTSSLAIVEADGQKVALLSFNITDNPLNKTDAEAALKSAYEQARYVVVYIHWGAEYQSNPNINQIELAHWFIDNGVDAVVGAHPHWMQSVEVYNNRPIIYSLGNFIFDQDWSQETNFGLVAGLSLNPNSTEVHLYPIQIIESQPIILEGADRQSRLDRLANISHESLEEQIKSGVMTLK